MKESSLTRSITERLWSIPGSYVVKIHGSAYGRRGVPDVLWVYHGRAAFIEVKTGSNKPTRLQALEAERIIRAGAVCRVIRSMAELGTLISEVTELEA